MPNVTELQVNGSKRRVEVDPDRTLLSVLRDDLDLTGAKYGCGEGECGACTVLIDGAPTRSCQKKIGTVGAKKIVTIESLEKDGKLHPLQQGFLEVGALQCGYCTPGILMTMKAFLEEKPAPTEQEVREALSGNLCRCTGYQHIVDAVLLAAARIRGELPG